MGKLLRAAIAPLAGMVGLATFVVSACSSSSSDATAGSGGQAAARPADAKVTEDLQGRPYELHAPTTTPSAPAPLLVMLHGFSNDPMPPEGMEKEMHVLPEAAKRGIYVAQPLGLVDPMANGSHYWNATDSCCGWDESYQTNDIGYIHAMITEIEHKYSIDPKRIFVFGHSNGGFMAHRLACDTAGRFAGIVSLAGAPWKNPAKCQPSSPIAMLQVHGDMDTTVLYGGGSPYNIVGLPAAPGAIELTQMWSGKNRCGATPDTSAPPIDIVTDLAGAETQKHVYPGCEANGATELWVIHGGVHSPNFNDTWSKDILDFLMAHPKG